MTSIAALFGPMWISNLFDLIRLPGANELMWIAGLYDVAHYTFLVLLAAIAARFLYDAVMDP